MWPIRNWTRLFRAIVWTFDWPVFFHIHELQQSLYNVSILKYFIKHDKTYTLELEDIPNTSNFLCVLLFRNFLFK